MCYCAEIKKLMKESKETGKPVISTSEKGIFFVKYSDEYEDYTFQYSWKISADESEVKQEVHNALTRYQSPEVLNTENIDILQIGLVSVYDTNADVFCYVIEHAKSSDFEKRRDTKYVFSGNKVLRIVQYHGQFANPFEYISDLCNWNQKDAALNENMLEVAKGLGYSYLEGSDSVIFSIGYDNKKTVFNEKITNNIPQLLRIDSMQGVTEFCVINDAK